MTRSTKTRPHRLRQLAYAPLIAAIAAGALCTGAGTSTAAAGTTHAPTTPDTPHSGNAYNWYLLNHTGQPIYGTWDAKMDSGDHSEVKTDKDHPWKPDDAAKATQYQYGSSLTTWTGHICYNTHSWDYTHTDYHYGEKVFGYGNPIFTLEADSTGTPWVSFDVYDFGVRHIHREALKPGTGSC
ncbi:hypothetical protein R3Q06_32320 [Rhodococcus erythropolis]|uniref:hypothetical protein n=1 Tax=Rhodococcus erythropolis TaxID=1833 RepID=UPI0029497BE2|nr:hypothetical protein [Rhodococcus erythropolis]MDV6278159.1 hypothetical protein [Rhodococcus erythropolis]